MRKTAKVLCLICGLAACDGFPVAGNDPSTVAPQPSAPLEFGARTPESFEIESRFQRVESNLIARGLLRIDGGGPDVPFTDEMVARNFNTLAFSEEFNGRGGRLIRQTVESTLHRWTLPVTIEAVFGPSVDPEQVRQDTNAISAFSARLARVTKHPIRMTERGGNFRVLVLNDQELRQSGALLKRFMPELSAPQIRFVEDMSPETYCVVFSSDPDQDGNIQRAVAVIRAELPERLRTSCYHEEISQGLGLSNDSPAARPSIFNDDDEFGRLTNHDEILLEILYDDRLAPGITRAAAAPLVKTISTGLMSPTT